MDKMKVSQKIAELRARNGLTAKELGDKIEKSETMKLARLIFRYLHYSVLRKPLK